MLNHAPLFISVSLAVLYAFGLAAHQGFLDALGLEETQFELSLHRTFYQGFVVMADWGAKGFGMLTVAALAGPTVLAASMLAHTAWNWLEKFLPRTWRSRERPDEVSASAASKTSDKASVPSKWQEVDRRRSGTQPDWEKWTVLTGKSFNLSGGAVFLFLIFMFAMYSATMKGLENGKKFKDDAGLGLRALSEIKVKKKTDCVYGHPIVCTTSACGYWVDSTAIVLATADMEWVKTLGKGTTKSKTLNKSCSLPGASPEAPATSSEQPLPASDHKLPASS